MNELEARGSEDYRMISDSALMAICWPKEGQASEWQRYMKESIKDYYHSRHIRGGSPGLLIRQLSILTGLTLEKLKAIISDGSGRLRH